MNKQKIIVTGSSGFVGKNLCPYLNSLGFEVKKLSLRDERWKEEISQDVYAIIHLAGLAHDIKNTRQEDDYFKVNRDLTQELFRVFSESNCEKFIYFSSVKASADSLGERILKEEDPPKPGTPYGKSKLEAERLIITASENLPNKKYYILRPTMIHGPGNKGNLNLLYKMISKGIPYPFGAFNNLRSFLSIDNLNFIVGELCTNAIPSGIYNLADDEPLSTIDLIHIINEGIGKKSNTLKVSKKFVKLIAKVGDVLPIPFNSEKLKKLTESYQVSNEKILKTLGKKLPLASKEGLLKTIQSFNQ